MGNVLEKAKQEQVIGLERLGWSLRRLEEATGVRRETAGGYLRSAGIALRTPGGWGAAGFFLLRGDRIKLISDEAEED
jgi:hypothetical protein